MELKVDLNELYDKIIQVRKHHFDVTTQGWLKSVEVIDQDGATYPIHSLTFDKDRDKYYLMVDYAYVGMDAEDDSDDEV
jgi:hypothetical protein